MNAAELIPISMEEAVGYPEIDCSHQTMVEESLVLKHDRIFLLVNSHGDIPTPGQCALGLFQDDTRMLSHYQLTFAGGPPSMLSAQAARMYSAQVDLAISDSAFGGDSWDPKNSVHIRRELMVEDRLMECVTLTSFVTTPIDFWVELTVGCDFADIFEIRGWHRAERGQFYRPQVAGDRLGFTYKGLDGKLIRSAVRFESEPHELDHHRARWAFRLEPNEPYRIRWEVLPDLLITERDAHRKSTVQERRAALEGEYENWQSECSQWISDVEEFNTALDQSIVDLRALYVTTDGGEIISAGIPWYSTAFGRDSIITSLQTLPVNPRIALDTLRYLARHQGEREDPYTEEAPGKIMHELRRGEMARTGEIPHVPYYGTIDATPLWLVLLHETWRWTGDDDLVRELLPNAERALAWIDDYGDLDGDGFVEYARTSENGLINQGWKDSGDGIPFPDGTLPTPPIALVEVQGYVCDAKRRMAGLYAALGNTDQADKLRREAEALKEAILRDFWLEELGTFAVALDGEKVPIPTVTTNAGHLLWSRVPHPEQARRMADSYTGSDLFSGWGIRTLSAEHAVYNPMSYHDGSIWPHDNAIVALGLCLNGCTHAALPALSAMHDAANGMKYHRLPELFCGMDRAFGLKPVLYPVSCSPQAWASGSFFMFLQAVTGLLPDAPSRTLHIREPLLPQYLRELTLLRLKIGGSRVSLQFSRNGKRTLANLLEIEGEPLQVKIELSLSGTGRRGHYFAGARGLVITQRGDQMKLGMVGLGKMGANMTERLVRDGHEVVVYDLDPDLTRKVGAAEGATPASSLEEVVGGLPSPRVVWVMVPAGEPTEITVREVAGLSEKGDIVIDGGNTMFRDTMRRSEELQGLGIHLLDAGTSGGVWGLKEGYCLMVGGPDEAVRQCEPIFRTLAPENGYAHVGPSGAGHFTKMVHNGIEYGLLQAYAEGFQILHASDFPLDLKKIAGIWNHGSVVRSWLLELLEIAYDQEGEDLERIAGWVADSGEGRWTVQTAIDLNVPAPVITLSLLARFRSRQEESYSAQVIAALRNQFGGHAVHEAKPEEPLPG